VVYKVVDARGIRILLRAHVKNLQEGLNVKFFVMKTNNNKRPVSHRSLVMFMQSYVRSWLSVRSNQKACRIPSMFHLL
jgi:hypothetical protein